MRVSFCADAFWRQRDPPPLRGGVSSSPRSRAPPTPSYPARRRTDTSLHGAGTTQPTHTLCCSQKRSGRTQRTEEHRVRRHLQHTAERQWSHSPPRDNTLGAAAAARTGMLLRTESVETRGSPGRTHLDPPGGVPGRSRREGGRGRRSIVQGVVQAAARSSPGFPKSVAFKLLVKLLLKRQRRRSGRANLSRPAGSQRPGQGREPAWRSSARAAGRSPARATPQIPGNLGLQLAC